MNELEFHCKILGVEQNATTLEIKRTHEAPARFYEARA
jgi:hypothetical protein